ncbi:MAG: hypothetical protein ACYCW5_06335 [Thermoleophilia bacterium]
MRSFNRALYFICAVCIGATAVLLLINMWAEIDSKTMWKFVGSGLIIIAASVAMLLINFLVLKIKAGLNCNNGATSKIEDEA